MANGSPMHEYYEHAERIHALGVLLDDVLPKGALIRNHPIAAHTTYKVGGNARLWAQVNTIEHLVAIAHALMTEALDTSELGTRELGACDRQLPVMILGRGSNLLVSDNGFQGLALSLGGDLKRFRAWPNGSVVVGGAVLMPVLSRYCSGEGLTGLEWAVGVPGTVGGSVRMNAGCYGSDMSKILVDADIVDLYEGKKTTLTSKHFQFRYRNSNLKDHQVVVEARLQLAIGDAAKSLEHVSEVVRWRRAKQPGGRNAGSVFLNPDDVSAGCLIDAVGAKGLRIGTAAVSRKHANFIRSDEMGKASDIVSLMTEIRERVSAAYDIDMRVETRLIGFTSSEISGLL